MRVVLGNEASEAEKVCHLTPWLNDICEKVCVPTSQSSVKPRVVSSGVWPIVTDGAPPLDPLTIQQFCSVMGYKHMTPFPSLPKMGGTDSDHVIQCSN